MSARKPTDWGDIYWKYRRKGEDHGSCADRADRWQARNSKTRKPAAEDPA